MYRPHTNATQLLGDLPVYLPWALATDQANLVNQVKQINQINQVNLFNLINQIRLTCSQRPRQIY